jgi:H+-transporting ATPase
VDEAASIDVLCADKTGTLTQNQLSVTTVQPMPGFNESRVLTLAALASSDGGQDPVDEAIRSAAAKQTSANPPKLVQFKPFDPATKMSEATATDSSLGTLRIVKGAFTVVVPMAAPSPTAAAVSTALEGKGFRVLAVAAGPPAAMQLLGLIALSDPAREDSAALVTQLQTLGVRTVMVTGDAATTASIVAHAVGLDGAVCPPGRVPEDLVPATYAVFAGVLPEDKFKLVKAFQKAGNIVGMCGDGANDAAALRQAQMGIAVSTATDVAKSAAGMVLTNPGLVGIVAAIKEGRITFQRIQTYTLNSLTKKIVQVLLLGFGLIMTGHAILTPMLMIIVMMVGDVLGMSLTTDHVQPSLLPNRWHIGKLTMAAIFMGFSELAFCVGIVAFGHFRLGLGLATLQTLAFFTLVCGNQATTYAVRARGRIWSPPLPCRWLVVSSIVDLLIAATLAGFGLLMVPLPFWILGGVLVAAAVFTFILDLVKVPVFGRLNIA